MNAWFWILSWPLSILAVTGNGLLSFLFSANASCVRKPTHLSNKSATRSGRFARWNKRCSFTVLLRDDHWLQHPSFHSWRYGFCKVAICVCLCDELVQFSVRSLYSRCETFKIPLTFVKRSRVIRIVFLVLGSPSYVSNDYVPCFAHFNNIACLSFFSCG